MANELPQASGVQELISRIRDDGVEAGKKKAGEIVAEARQEAARLLAEARSEAAETHRKASAEIESFRHAALEALKKPCMKVEQDCRSCVHSETLSARSVTVPASTSRARSRR